MRTIKIFSNSSVKLSSPKSASHMPMLISAHIHHRS